MESPTSPSRVSRRRFLQQSSSTLAAPAILTAAASLRAAEKADSAETLRIGLIGCGGRGTGAANQALGADYNSRLVAVADVFSDQIDTSLNSLSQKFPDRVTVDDDHRFVGLDAYQKLLNSDVDVVLLATPPGFRPVHLQATVDAGKHIFCEKPMAVDALGYHMAMAAVEQAKKKNINLVAGFCWRYSPSRREAFAQLADGAIGDVAGIFATYYGGPAKPMAEAAARTPEMSDVEWQLRNWYNFSYLSGDSIVEQAVHSIDKICWAMGDKPPVECIGTGGRQVPSPGGNIYDHFHAAYDWGDGIICNLGSRQIKGCDNQVLDVIHGTKGTLTIGKGTAPYIMGEKRWRFRGEDRNMYDVEHEALFSAIREGKVINDGDRMMLSTLVAILGREVAYTGKRITWEQILASKQDLAPDTLKWGDSFDPGPRPEPGITPFI
ncbi:MAG: Gfo/Idh/MocA family oxidoreductase [Verrucomicrobiales bacterium]|nr:Gfo/Idh/MocA family oxidoreductase [Verrucomicrobiales bacterium]